MLAIHTCWREALFPISEKVKVLNLIGKKKSHPDIAEIYGKKETSICELVKEEKEIGASFAVRPETANVTTTVSSEW